MSGLNILAMFREQSTTYAECRWCGTTLSAEATECHHCKSTEIAHYEW